MKNLFYSLIAVLFWLGGCASYSGKPHTVIMQDPETMHFVNCNVDKWATAGSYAENEKCVEGLKEQGFIVWAER